MVIVDKLYVLNVSYETIDKEEEYTHITEVSFDKEILKGRIENLKDKFYGVKAKIEEYPINSLIENSIILQKIQEK
ncbi:MAG: hypothetical protein ACRDDY_03425 [Clostridium sp.]|uniref:hypothetical protein n=1 Tax=Clostridium sp. TaxID=1506 RepID=UPI003EE53FE3